MLCQSPRLFHAAALRETLYGMSVRLGHAEAVCCSFYPGMRSRTQDRKQALQHANRRSRALRTCAGSLGQATLPSGYETSSEVSEQHLKGEINLIVGPMFAGKTSELLRRVEDHEAAGHKVALVKSSIDTRYHSTRIVTHDGHSKACYATASLAELRESLGSEYSSYSVIAIDEAQFLPDLLQFCSHAADVDNKQILIAGLDGDFRRQRFGQVLDLVPFADRVTKLGGPMCILQQQSALQHQNSGKWKVLDLVPLADSVTKLGGSCAYCSSRALFSLRIAADKRQALVGGADKYAPVCRRHYTELNDLRPQEE